MAKPAKERVRGYVRARRAKPSVPSPRRIRLTPALAARVRYLFEHTETPLSAIAAEISASQSVVSRMAAREDWKRYVAPPRDLSNAARLLAQATALEEGAPLTASRHPEVPAEGGPRRITEEGDGPAAPSSCEGGVPPPPQDDGNHATAATHAEDIDRLERALRRELEIVEAMRARLGRQPQAAIDAERTARTLANLTTVLFKVQRLRCGLPEKAAPYEDDMPADIDAFRDELARRIRAFFDLRRGTGRAAGA